MDASHNTQISPNGQDKQLYLLQSGRRIPVKREIYKHGGGIICAYVNHEEGINIPLMATVNAMEDELQASLQLVQVAKKTNDQGYLSAKKDGPR